MEKELSQIDIEAAALAAVVLDHQDEVWQKGCDGIWYSTLDTSMGSDELIGRAPLRLLWKGWE